MGNYLFLLLILACPLMMIWMMRGMHGGKADAGNPTAGRSSCHNDSTASLDELRRRRDQLDREIEQREAEEQTPTPVGGGWR